NTQKLLSGGSNGGGSFTANFQIGANHGQSMEIEIFNMSAAALGLEGSDGAVNFDGTVGASVGELTDNGAVTNAQFSGGGVNNGTNSTSTGSALDVTSHEAAAAAIEQINHAIETVSAQRSSLGAFQNRLEHTISNLDNSSENLQAAESRIRDV
ncbi:flagellin, partial [Halalkalibacter sp. APA_J-10(15)]|uniref:flagellin n=1 Tax=Halalkalibacter sp. APA_J-10(15) TaxID=2933805 RepID=UPI0021ADE7C9